MRRAWVTVIGIVKNAKQEDWAAEPDPEVYLPALQSRDFLGEGGGPIAAHMMYITLVVRADGNPIRYCVRREAHRLVI